MTEDDFLDEIQKRYGPINLNETKVFSMRTFAEMLRIAGVLDPNPLSQETRDESKDGEA